MQFRRKKYIFFISFAQWPRDMFFETYNMTLFIFLTLNLSRIKNESSGKWFIESELLWSILIKFW